MGEGNCDGIGGAVWEEDVILVDCTKIIRIIFLGRNLQIHHKFIGDRWRGREGGIIIIISVISDHYLSLMCQQREADAMGNIVNQCEMEINQSGISAM